MKVIINDDFYVEIDYMNHALFRRNDSSKNKGEKSEAFAVFGYYSNMENVIKAIRKILIGENKDILTLETYLIEVEKLNKDLEILIENSKVIKHIKYNKKKEVVENVWF